MSQASTITCRRCGEVYVHAPRKILSACPRCGASPAALRHHLRHNGLAAVLAVLALIVLVVGMVMPFISMTKLGTSRIYSLVGGILELFHSGDIFIGAVLLTFSAVFPIVKLLMLLVATSGLVGISDAARRRMHTIALFTGKYSLLDLVVVAVTIMLVKFGSFAEVRAQPGTILFCVAVLCSLAAGWCVDLDDDDPMNDSAPASSPTESTPKLRRSRPYLRLLWLIPALAMLGVGLHFQYNVEEGGEVSAIKLTTKPGVVGQAAEAVANLSPSNPDLYIKISATTGEQTLPTFKNTPIGNGLTWNLPRVYRLQQLQRVEVWNHHTLWKDKPLDRITLTGWSTDGQLYHVDLLGKKIEAPKWSLPLAAVGGALTLLALLRFVWDQVI